MSQLPSTAVGQVSADGQFRWDGTQWVPIPRGTREPTSWTRPMQLTAAGLFVAEAVYSVIVSLIYINPTTMRQAMEAQGTSIPQGTDAETVINISVAVALAFVIGIAVCELVAAVGSYLGWRWMFWVALVLFGLGAIGALTNIGTLMRPETSPVPLWGVAISELFAIVSLALFVWMLIAVIRFGPWAMKRPGA
ncbi:MAG TPA: hypothetical protein VGA47_03045 [Candidatus Dormibacteraeota bacterium]